MNTHSNTQTLPFPINSDWYVQDRRYSITILENGDWAGEGHLCNGVFADSTATLGTGDDMEAEAFETIENAIREGNSSVVLREYKWDWILEPI